MQPNAFVTASKVEARSWEILRPFIEVRCFDGRYVKVAKGPIARDLQKTVGDVIYNTDDDTAYSIEIKAEERFTGNLFLERWSNRSRFTPGWLETLQCDILMYHFLSNNHVFAFHFSRLRKWFYECEHMKVPVAGKYPQAKQGKYSQMNDTWGYIVPIVHIPQDAVKGRWALGVEQATQTSIAGAA